MLRAANDFWARASSRERALLAIAAVVVAGGIGYAGVWQPTRADVDRLHRDLPREHALLAVARAQAADLVALEKAAPAVRGPVVPALERVFAERGVRADAGTLDEKDGRVRINLAAVRFDVLVPLLDAVARDTGLRVVESTLTQRVEPGVVRVELVLGR